MSVATPIRNYYGIDCAPIFIPGAGGILPETGELHPRSQARLDVAIQAVRLGVTSAVLFSGGGAIEGVTNAEAVEMKDEFNRRLGSAACDVSVYWEDEAERSISNWTNIVPLLEVAGVLERGKLVVVTDEAHWRRLAYIGERTLPREIEIVPFINRYRPNKYEQRREVIGMRVTEATLAGLPLGAGPEAVLRREAAYGFAKRVVRPAKSAVSHTLASASSLKKHKQ